MMPPILTAVVRLPSMQWPPLSAMSIYPESQSMKHGILLHWTMILRVENQHTSQLRLPLTPNPTTPHQSFPQEFFAAHLLMRYPINRAASQMVVPNHQARVRPQLSQRGEEAILGSLRDNHLRMTMTQTSKMMLWSENPQPSLHPNPLLKTLTRSSSAVIVRISTQG